MIRIYPASEAPKIVRKYVSIDEEVFLQARDFFHRNKDIRHHKVVVYDHEKPVFCLGFMKNNPTNVDKDNPRVQMQLSNFWEYSPDDRELDYSYADRFEFIIYHELEEYSYHTARIIRRHNPDMVIAFTDPNAAFFFQEDERLILAESEDELFQKRPDLRTLKTLRADSEIKWDVQGVFTNRVSSYVIMTSLYWIKREFYYGPLNPDKTFYLIKQPVKENGLTALIANVIGTKQMIRHIRPDFIPVVDLGVAGDPNQFAGTTGEDVWSMFFGKIESVFQNAELYRRAGRAHKMSGIGRERFLRCCDLRLRKRNGL